MTFRNWLLSSALLSLVGCSSGTDAPTSSNGDVAIAQSNVARVPASEVPSSALGDAVLANNAFALALYSQSLKRDPDKNLLTSPISATLALTMAYAGAVGTTKSEMASALQLPSNADDSIFAGQNALSQALNARAGAALASAQQIATQSQQAAPNATDYDLQVVNSVWGEKTYTWEQPFLNTLAANYGTGVYQQDFVHAFEPARATINAWVSTHTSDKIKDLLVPGSLDDLTRMVLVNAIHLKLPWDTKFDASQTKPADFQASGGPVSTDFMHRGGHLAYEDDGKAQIVSLPLAHRDLSVVIALPHAGTTLADYEAALAAGSALIASPRSSALVDLALPKVTFTSPSVSLTEALQALGMHQAFDPDAADFSALCSHPPDGLNLYVGDVLQKAMIAIQETGVEAAAATAVVLAGNASAEVDPPVVVNVNRPYLVAIVDEPTGAILMLGQIQDPTQVGSP